MFYIEKGKKKFDSTLKPMTPRWYLQLVEWAGMLFYNIKNGMKIHRKNTKGLKKPYMIISNHASMVDFTVALKAAFPHRINWICSIEEYVGREWLFRHMGHIHKRKFTNDVSVVKHSVNVIRRKRILCFYPEARYSLCGINERLDNALGKFIKLCKCPVTTLIMHGNFLTEPQWNKVPNRNVPVEAEFEQIITEEEARTLSAEELQRRVEEKFNYDDYAWQRDNKIKIKCKERATNIHRILYQCPVCKTEFEMEGKGINLTCHHCGANWEMNEYGQLHRTNGEDVFTHVPDWYKWERENVCEEVARGYSFSDKATLYHLTCSHDGFKDVGTVDFSHNENGFTLDGTLNNGEHFHLNRTVPTMYSCHIEYGFHKKGVPERDCIDITDGQETYFVAPINAKDVITKIHFATEQLYYKHEKEKGLTE